MINVAALQETHLASQGWVLKKIAPSLLWYLCCELRERGAGFVVKNTLSQSVEMGFGNNKNTTTLCF